MAACEKCWGNAFTRSVYDHSKSQADHYRDILEERKDSPCTEKEQAGQWWDEERQINTLLED